MNTQLPDQKTEAQECPETELSASVDADTPEKKPEETSVFDKGIEPETIKAKTSDGEQDNASAMSEQQASSESTDSTDSVDQEAEAETVIEPDWGWLNSLELTVYKAIHEREEGGASCKDVILDMEEPIYRLMGAALLLSDVAYGALRDTRPRAMSLNFLAQATMREAQILYRLYHGHHPSYHEGD